MTGTIPAMRKTVRSLALFLALLPALAAAQTFPTVPANTVIGRLGIGPGPAQAIPFATLSVNLFGAQSANKVLAGPASGAAGAIGFRALVGADLPAPGASSLGGVNSSTAPSHQFVTGLSTAGALTTAQPAFSDLSNSATCSQLPALTGNVTTSAGSCVTTFVALPSGVFANPSASIGLTANNGVATTAMRSDATPALSQTITPTWTGTHIWNSGGIFLGNGGSPAPPFSVGTGTNPYFGSASNTWQLVNTLGTSATVPETGFQSIVNSSAGSANAGTAFKMAIFGATTVNSGAASGYGANIVAASTTNFSSLLTGLEVDLNQGSGLAQGGPGATNASYNIVLSGNPSAAHPATAAIWITGSSVWSNGIYVSNGVVNNTFTDVSSSGTSIVIGGSHSYAIDTTGGTFAGPVFHLGNNQSIAWRNAANNADLSGISVDASNNLVLGGTGVAKVNSTVSPGATNTAAFSLINSHATASDIVLQLQGGTPTSVDTSTLYVNFVNPGNTAQRGSITANDSAGVGHVAYNTASDERLKQDYGLVSDSLDRLMRLKVHAYTGKGYKGDAREEGFFAQELHSVYPFAVTPSSDPDFHAHPWQVDYGRVTPLLVGAIQDTKHEIDRLAARLTALEQRGHRRGNRAAPPGR